ncbi:hypothetical protein SKAU_G00405800 [Synaphobranchus kaupii]|uniref:C2H2-type domain-containing protein n=1 Tax=Synaphobranchus kaupii TaxID=118154 RepID=A0A9Q1EA13_SYNKA|nr:hypothetical protein SKAU_G00405800 [Synaphobranchus kaupii]
MGDEEKQEEGKGETLEDADKVERNNHEGEPVEKMTETWNGTIPYTEVPGRADALLAAVPFSAWVAFHSSSLPTRLAAHYLLCPLMPLHSTRVGNAMPTSELWTCLSFINSATPPETGIPKKLEKLWQVHLRHYTNNNQDPHPHPRLCYPPHRKNFALSDALKVLSKRLQMRSGTLAMSMELDMMEVEQVVVGEGIETTVDLAPDDTEDTYKVVVKEPPAPLLIPAYQHDNLQCYQCFITFCNSKAKERHMKKSHREEYKQQLQQQSDTLFSCYICERTFLSSVELTDHQATHSKEDKPFKCTHCQESFRTFSEVTSHRRYICLERQCTCWDCGESFRGMYLLRAHRAARHPTPPPGHARDESKTHRCAKCGRGFEEEEELLRHQENHAGEQRCNGGAPTKRRGRPPRQAEPADGEKGESPGNQGGGVQAGRIAGGTAGGAKGRRGRPPKSAQRADLPQDPAEAEAETGEAPQHLCLECKASFPAVSQLRAHRKEKHGQPPSPPRKHHACKDCEESFSRPEQLEAHTARVHGAGRHTCPTCGKSFGRENSLRAHQQTHTSAEEPEDGGHR